MNPAAIFIARPVMTTLVMVLAHVHLAGVQGLCASFPSRDLPNVDFPTLTISASPCPGASPETMASVRSERRSKRQFSTIAGVDSMNSTSTLGSSTQVTLQFNLESRHRRCRAGCSVRDDHGWRTAIFPDDHAVSPPSFRKANPG